MFVTLTRQRREAPTIRSVAAGSPLGVLLLLLTLSVGLAASGATARAGSADLPDTPRERQRMQCLLWLDRGYPSGIAEKGCQSEFNLPSAYLVKCVRGLRTGYESPSARSACALYLAKATARVEDGYLRR